MAGVAIATICAARASVWRRPANVSKRAMSIGTVGAPPASTSTTSTRSWNGLNIAATPRTMIS